MNWENYWNQSAKVRDRLAQVGRVNCDREIAVPQAAGRILKLLEIKTDEQILDVCCGNGLITDYIFQKGFDISGVDFSAMMIENAKRNNQHIKYFKQDAFALQLGEQFNKIFIAFSFQYFNSYDKGKIVITNLIKHAKPGALLLLTDIPDKSKWNVFYNSFLKKLFFVKQKITGSQIMGKFWNQTELQSICESLGVKGEVIQQPADLPYSHYRFDYLIRT